MARTIFNCGIIKDFKQLGQKTPKQINGKCEGYNTEYYYPDGHFSACDKCKLNTKYGNKA